MYSVAFGMERYAAAWSIVRMPRSMLVSIVVLIVRSFVATRTGLPSYLKVCTGNRLVCGRPRPKPHRRDGTYCNVIR